MNVSKFNKAARRQNKLYPELCEKTLREILSAFQESSAVQMSGGDSGDFSLRAIGSRRHSQISLAAQERLIMSDLWEGGVCVGDASSTSFSEVAKFLQAALSQHLSLTALQNVVLCFHANNKGLAQEKGAAAYVDNAWEDYARMLNETHPNSSMASLVPLLEATAQVAQLRQLMVFTSMYWLCFSCCTDYPFSGDCPCAGYNAETNQYEIYPAEENPANPHSKFFSARNATEAAQMLADALPPNCGPAVLGTAEDLK